MELYKFVLVIMDDEELLSGSQPLSDNPSWMRKSALPVSQIAELTIFLKHLAFSMYWYGSEITGIQKEESRQGLSQYFGTNSYQPNIEQVSFSARQEEPSLAGMPGMTLPHLKGMVTGLLRMIYERE